MKTNLCKDILFGIAVGDALGVPVEFLSRESISNDPVNSMCGYGTHKQPAGTFSDDTSLSLCLAEALTEGFNLSTIADNFIKWLNNNYWTARGNVFDVGIATSQAIKRLQKGFQPELAGGFEVSDNGNGSLMRILPLVVYTKDQPISERYEMTKKVSSITHAHIRSVIACFYYLEFAKQLIEKADKFDIYKKLQTEIPPFLSSLDINPEEITHFDRLFNNEIYHLTEKEIHSSGYVLHTLEASIWSLLTTSNYREATLKAVNLGNDTDTTAAVTGGLAALLYGWQTIPSEWLENIARKNDIEDLANRLASKL